METNQTFHLAENCRGDLRKLLAERLLATSRSGGGKSWLLRKILEETHGKVQQIVIDPDGEFASLRATFDYLVCKPEGGDVALAPDMARILARKLMETGASAILDIYDMNPDDRQEFVALFLHELMNLPRDLWHNLLVVMDEAHLFAPEGQRTEAGRAVIDLATRGRKRGFGLVLATQRLASLNKNVAAQMINKAIGGTGLDLDLTRSMGEIGSKSKEREKEIKHLKTGEFLIYGPAFDLQEPRKVKVGMVRTSHPEAGAGLMQATPAPSAQIKAIIAKSLADLPKQAEKVAETEAELRQELARMQAELRGLKANRGITEEEITALVDREVKDAIRHTWGAAADQVRELESLIRKEAESEGEAESSFREDAMARIHGGVMTLLAEQAPPQYGYEVQHVRAADLQDNTPGKSFEGIPFAPTEGPGWVAGSGQVGAFKKGAREILGQLVAALPKGWTRSQVATLVTMSPSSGTFSTYLSNLKQAGAILDQNGILFATAKGKMLMGKNAPRPKTQDEMVALWMQRMKLGARRMLQALLMPRFKAGMTRQALAEVVGMEATSGTFSTYLSNLKKNNLIEIRNGLFYASSMLTGK